MLTSQESIRKKSSRNEHVMIEFPQTMETKIHTLNICCLLDFMSINNIQFYQHFFRIRIYFSVVTQPQQPATHRV